MSSETSAWAKEQRCGDPVTKAVLREIANWAKPTGICEFLAVNRIAEVTEVNKRTVQRHLIRLETPIAEGGLGLIRRVHRHRDDGGQSASSFELVGYKAPASAAGDPRDKLSPPHDNLSLPPRQNVRGPHDNRVTPKKRQDILPPSPPDGGEAPAADFEDDQGEEQVEVPAEPVKPHPLPADWTAPLVADLPAEARALVEQWPAGAYEAVSECFRLYYRGRTRGPGRKPDWSEAHAKWLMSDHAKVMRDAKAGVSFAALAPATPGVARRAETAPTPAKARENHLSGAVHAAIAEIGDHWGKRLASSAVLICDDGDGDIGVTVIAPSEFQRTWLESHCRPALTSATEAAIGALPNWIKFEVESAPAVSGGKWVGNEQLVYSEDIERKHARTSPRIERGRL